MSENYKITLSALKKRNESGVMMIFDRIAKTCSKTLVVTIRTKKVIDQRSYREQQQYPEGTQKQTNQV